jgi:hypothetical protein
MIIDALLNALTNAATFVFGLFPAWSLPSWWSNAMTGWGTIITGISDLSHWVPLAAVGQVAIAVFLVSAFAFAVRVLRIILSFISGGGGSAA